MKELYISAGKWILGSILLAVMGLLLVTGLGRHRGTRAYSLRMALWHTALAVLGGTTLLGSTLLQQGCRQGEAPHSAATAPAGQAQPVALSGSAPRPLLKPLAEPDAAGTGEPSDPAADVPEFDGETVVLAQHVIPPVGPQPTLEEAFPEPIRLAPVEAPPRPAHFTCYSFSPAYYEMAVYKRTFNQYLHSEVAPLQKCFLDIARKNASVGGRLLLRVKVATNGKAVIAVVSDSTGDPELAGCVIKKLERWTFPRPPEELSIEVPFVFRAE